MLGGMTKFGYAVKTGKHPKLWGQDNEYIVIQPNYIQTTPFSDDSWVDTTDINIAALLL